jgi:hypothetical protein
MPKPQDQDDTETQSDFDMPSATAEISSDLFGQGEDEEGKGGTTDGEEGPTEGEGVEASGDHATVEGDDAPPQPVEDGAAAPSEEGDDNSAAVQETGAPKTWTKEALETWATIPERAQQEIIKREEDFLRGISSYKAAAEVGQAYDSVVEPYKPILAAENIDPVQMFQSFAANHYILSKGTPEQKIELAAAMLSGYDIPLPELLNYLADNDQDLNPVDPRVAQLEQRLTEVTNLITTAQTRQTERSRTAILSEVEKFASDPAHPHFDELATDIQKLFEAGLATTLQEAYDKAVFANPVTRAKEIDRLTAEARSSADQVEKTRKDKIAKSTADHVTLTPKSRDGTVPTGSIDDTLAETMASIESRG